MTGEADGFLYYVMPLIEGESLRQKLDRERQPPEEVLSFLPRLGTTHRHGVIHRDIKPQHPAARGAGAGGDFGIALA